MIVAIYCLSIVMGFICAVGYLSIARFEAILRDCKARLAANDDKISDRYTRLLTIVDEMKKDIERLEYVSQSVSLDLKKLSKNYQDLEDIKASINFCEERREIAHPFEERFDKELAALKKDYKHRMEMHEQFLTSFRVENSRLIENLPDKYPILKLHVGEEEEEQQPKRKPGRPRKQ